MRTLRSSLLELGVISEELVRFNLPKISKTDRFIFKRYKNKLKQFLYQAKKAKNSISPRAVSKQLGRSCTHPSIWVSESRKNINL